MEKHIFISLYQVCVLVWGPPVPKKIPKTVLTCQGRKIATLKDPHKDHFRSLELNFMEAGFYNAANKDKKGKVF